ncbi:MAG: glycoside hydrolase family 3 C-terminal domain-containing protein, partial [Bacteroidales bacterium]|nr:glycoside hydrolase family 3 C-terminal domain-containing protein [Bacteroidales bacterium]
LSNGGYKISESMSHYYTAKIDSLLAGKTGNKKYLVTNHPEFSISGDLITKEAKQSDMAVITLGRLSGEGADRPEKGYFTLSETEQKLIVKVCEVYHALGKKVVVVLNIGGVIETASWKKYPDAILLAWQTGQQGGAAVNDILRGKVNPSGKLPMTYPVQYSDVPSAKSFPGLPNDGNPINSYYNEGIYVGYRYYSTFQVPVSYEFGYGMSYTSFEYSDIRLSSNTFSDKLTVKFKVTNTGKCSGKEVAQLYLSAPATELDKPALELKRYLKTKELVPMESQEIIFELDPMALASFRTGISSWIADRGSYTIRIGSSSADIRLEAKFDVPNPIVVEKLNDALYPNLPIKDLNTRSIKVLKEKTPFDKWHQLMHDFQWHW